MGLVFLESSRKFFCLIIQVVGIAIIALTLVHIYKYRGGFGGRDDPKHEFCWHVLFMTLGFTYFLSNSLLAFRILPLMTKPKMKLVHSMLNIAVVICACLGSSFIVDERKALHLGHLQSLHSWIGIAAICLLILQAICGAMVYIPSHIPLSWKEKIMPWHIRFGIVIFLLGTAAVLTGMKKGNTETERLILNFTGASAIILCFLVLYLLGEQSYKFSCR